MADTDSSLPIRTEAAGDVDINVSDATTPSQKLKVNADGSIDTNFASGSSVDASGSEVSLDAATLAALETTTVVATDLDIRDLVFATDKVDASGSEVSLDAATLAALETTTVVATDLDIRDLNATDDKVQAHLFDESGTAYSAANPLAVEMVQDQLGDELCDFNTSSSVAKNASVNHDYTVTAGKTLLAESVWASASGKIKVQVLSNAAIIFVGFNSTANPNIDIPLRKLCKTAATQVVRITITNLDNGAQDVYSTLTGLEI